MATKRVSVKGAARKATADQKREMKAKARRTGDSFQNFLSNVGIGTDNLTTGNTYGFNPITNERTLIEWMYRGSWICAKAVDCVADDMTRGGVQIESTLKPDQLEKIENIIQRTEVWTKLNLALKWSRLYGGAIAVMLIDGQDMSTPLNVETVGIGAFKGLQVLDRWQAEPTLENLVTELGPELGHPKFYNVVDMAPALQRRKIHHSRVFRLIGVDLPYWQALTLNLWGASVLEQLYDRLTAFDSTTQGAAQLVYRAHLRTLKVAKLREIIAAGTEFYAALLKQMQVMRVFQSNEGITLIDGEDEFETHSYSFAGLNETMMQFGQQISGATGIPLVRLFGQSPAGLNSTGESDLRNYYDNVKQEQENKLRTPFNTLINVIARSEAIMMPEGMTYSFRPLWQLTAKEKADVGEIKTRTAQAVFESGVISEQTFLKELRSQSQETGVWTTITDEDIEKADAEPPDPMEMMQGQVGPDGQPLPGAGPEPGGDAVPEPDADANAVRLGTSDGKPRLKAV